MRARLPYQPALDGLRGVAVLAVLLYHADVAADRGGFLGVDVFFVLSGYLITTLLMTEYARSSAIDLWAFWLRRARRLLPAVLVLLVAVVVGTRVINPDRLRSVSSDALATFFYVANWHAATSGQSYFAQFLEPSPLIHTWSLSIEEQFYLVFPVLLLAVLWAVRRRRALLLTVFACLAVASAGLMAATYRPAVDPSAVYYSTFTRAQDLLVGAVLGLALLNARPDRTRRAVEVAGWVGAVVVVGAILTVSESDSPLFRGGFLVLSVAVALVIRAAIASGSTLGRGLAWNPLRLTGVVSYGLYLWHWPVFVVLSPSRTGLEGVSLLAPRLALTAAAAFLSYRLVEQPVRTGRLISRLPRPWVWTGAVTATAAVLAVVLVSSPAAVATVRGVTVTGQESTRIRPEVAGTLSVLVAGDSTAQELAGRVPVDVARQLTVSSSTLTGCGVAVQQIVLGGQVTPEQKSCRTWPTEWQSAVASARPQVSVLAVGTWEVYDHEVGGTILRVGTPAYSGYLLGVLQRAVGILGSGGRPVAVLDVPCFRRLPWAPTGVDVSALQNDPARARLVNGVLAELAARSSGQVTVLRQSSVLCTDGHPATSPDGAALRPDGVHVGAAGGPMLWRWLAPQLVRLAAARPVGCQAAQCAASSQVLPWPTETSRAARSG